jgi:hypothetical protein
MPILASDICYTGSIEAVKREKRSITFAMVH